MLKDEDRIFQNLYNDFGAELDSAKLKSLNCVVVVEQVFQQV